MFLLDLGGGGGDVPGEHGQQGDRQVPGVA